MDAGGEDDSSSRSPGRSPRRSTVAKGKHQQPKDKSKHGKGLVARHTSVRKASLDIAAEELLKDLSQQLTVSVQKGLLDQAAIVDGLMKNANETNKVMLQAKKDSTKLVFEAYQLSD